MRQRKTMLFVSSGSTLIWALYFLLKGAHTAAAVILVGAFRILVGAYAVHWAKHSRLCATAGFIAIVSACSYLTWAGISSLPSTLAALLLTVASLNFPHQRLRYTFLLGDCLWIWNGFAVDSVFGVLSAFTGLVVNSVLLFRASDYRSRFQFTEVHSIRS
jgi:energy-converting hydrogenase Eha subunit C